MTIFTPTRIARTGTWLTAAFLGGALVSCDSTAKFSIPDRKFADIQVVTSFPAYIADDGSITRVCGPALTNEIDLEPNGAEFTVNFVSTSLKNPACEKDNDLSIKEGELIELSPLRTTGASSTVSNQNFSVQLDCVEPRGGATGSCPTGIQGDALTPASVKYEASSNRCSPSRPETWLNVALLIDASGSTSGLVDPTTNREDNPLPDTPSTLEPSDPGDARITASRLFVQSLNSKDRAIAYYFNEKNPGTVAASDNKGCIGGNDGKACLTDDDCAGGACLAGENPQGNTFELLALPDAQKKAFGSSTASREYLLAALEDSKIKDGGEGRAPLWQSIDVAYQHLKATVKENRHIVILTDGPDTCSHGEELTYVSSDGKCRTPCLNVDVDFEKLRQKMVDDGYPVQLHFVQWQSKGYKQPDAQMMEMACRTGGTYQFLNFEEMNKSDLDGLQRAMTKAMTRVRYAMGGSWRVGLKLNAMQKPPQGSVATGEVWAIGGFLKFQNQLFPSLATPYEYSTSWKFGFDSGNEDRRLLFRKSCSSASDCNGTDSCGANHCDVGGLCRSKAAPDKLPCSGGLCCSGTCSADCATACQ
ncbi:MAG: hypothetical protein H6747_06090 [Deltaproteobacteria bacterium]|nr:hypothetical protein [Deltaproteobacteria bacterium]